MCMFDEKRLLEIIFGSPLTQEELDTIEYNKQQIAEEERLLQLEEKVESIVTCEFCNKYMETHYLPKSFYEMYKDELNTKGICKACWREHFDYIHSKEFTLNHFMEV